MSANGEPKLKRVKLSLSSPTNDETSIRNVFCAVKSKRKYKKKPQVGDGLKLKIWEIGNEALNILWYDSKNVK